MSFLQNSNTEQIKLTRTDNQLLSGQSEDRSLVAELLHSAAYAAVQSPLKGVAQLVDSGAGTSLLPAVTFMDSPKEREFLSAKWHAQQFGAMVGMAAPFLLLHKGVGKCSSAAFGQAEASLAAKSVLTQRVVGEAMVTGALFEGVFKPTERNASNSEDSLAMSRLKQGLVGAATFGTLARASVGLQSLCRAETGMAVRVIGSDVGSSVISGAPAGMVNAELTSRLTRGTGASTKEFAQSIYSFSVLGGAVAGAKHFVGGTSPEQALATTLRMAPEPSALGLGYRMSLGEAGRLGAAEQAVNLAASRSAATENPGTVGSAGSEATRSAIGALDVVPAVPCEVTPTSKLHSNIVDQPAPPVKTNQQRLDYVFKELPIPSDHPNPLLARYEAAQTAGTLTDRWAHKLVEEYAHAVPTEEALAFLKSLGPVVEVGAGTGYWAALLRARGVQVDAYDNWTGYGYSKRDTFTEVTTGDASMTKLHPTHTLLLSWPSTHGAASTALSNFKGNRLAYVGEVTINGPKMPKDNWFSDVMGDGQFFEMLNRDWNMVSRIDTPQLGRVVKDAFFYFERKPREQKLLERHRAREAERAEREERKASRR